MQNLAPDCKAAGLATPEVQLYDNNAKCIQALKAYPDKQEMAVAVTLPYSVGIAVPRDKTDFRDAFIAAFVEIQNAGIARGARFRNSTASFYGMRFIRQTVKPYFMALDGSKRDGLIFARRDFRCRSRLPCSLRSAIAASTAFQG